MEERYAHSNEEEDKGRTCTTTDSDSTRRWFACILRVENDKPRRLPESVIKAAIFDQNKIGWYQFLRGLVAQSWQTAFDKTAKKKSSKPFLLPVMVHAWKYVYGLWKDHNQQVHGISVAEQDAIQRQEAIETIGEFIRRRNELPPRDQDLVPETREALDNVRTATLKTFVKSTSGYLTGQLKKAAERARSGARAIHAFFQVDPNSRRNPTAARQALSTTTDTADRQLNHFVPSATAAADGRIR